MSDAVVPAGVVKEDDLMITHSQQLQVRYPQAAEAFLVGAFNDWSTTANPMQRDGDNWVTSVEKSLDINRCAIFFLVPLADSIEHGVRYVSRIISMAGLRQPV